MRTVKKLLLPALLFTAATTALITPAPVEACGPYYLPQYNDNDANPYEILLEKRKAICRFVELYPEMLPPAGKFEKGLPTKEAAVQDFRDAVKRYLPKTPEAEQKKMITAFTNFMGTWSLTTGLKDYPELPPELDEFRLYLAGCTEMTPDGVSTPPPSWMKLLQLPPEKRHYRTVWVHYMLGNYCKLDLHTHYTNCRNAARAGFADTAGLARASYYTEVKFGRDPVKVVRTAIEALQNDPDYQQTGGDFLPWRYISNLPPAQYKDLVADPVCREVLAVLEGNTERFRYLSAGYKMKNADICAYHAYVSGNLKEAEKFLSQIEKPSLISLFLEAKIARHKGNNPRVIKKLRQWLEMAKNAKLADGAGVLMREDYGMDFEQIRIPLQSDVYGHLGNALLRRRDFVEAAECFFKCDPSLMSQDLAEILEIFLSLDEAVAFAERIAVPHLKEKEGYGAAWWIIDLVARRALREGREDIARKYMNMFHDKTDLQYLDQMNAYLAKSKDEKLSRDDRAIALLNAAKIMRFRGMELYGTQTAPDWYPGTICAYRRLSSTTEDLLDVINAPKDYRTVPVGDDFQFHYRRKAALMALEAGELAEDKDLKAFIHCFGGEILRHSLPLSADIFYKRMVLQSRGNILSESGDRLRWFPQTMNSMLIKELKSIEPIYSLDEVKDLMKRLAGSNLGALVAPKTEPAKEKK